ncbi:MAG: ABC transporter ATP-binding protein [Inquilinus limosus]|uniref:ABC transporter ATP-binding protein n=3 Tax=Inquilinus TaxID=171673 RepID=A0A952FKX0_9PROT|nr:ABC transporter ATP-binding protein [Inquilinus limosus]
MSDAAMTTAPEVLRLDGIRRSFHQGETRLDVLRGAELSLSGGEIVALVGPSGAGKSTLLHIAGLLEQPDGGTITIAGQRCDGLGDGPRTALRRSAIGFVYQFHHLLPEFSAIENVVLPQMIAGRSRSEARQRGRELLARVGLAGRLEHRPAQLSGGEQQRVAIARALANAPKVLIADEPTGNLDHTTSDAVFEMLLEVVRSTGVGALIATHNLDLAARMDRVVEMRDGVLAAR